MTRESEVDSWQGKKDFSLLHKVQIGSDWNLACPKYKSEPSSLAYLLEKASPLIVSRKRQVHVTPQILELGFLLAA
jgi:hypothetical protein